MRSFRILLTVLVIWSVFASAQTRPDESPTRPQPFAAIGLSAFDVIGKDAVGGLVWDHPHFYLEDEAGYQTGGKNDDNDNVRSSGHDRYLRGYAMVKVGPVAFGPGISWSKLYTPDYSKSHVHPKFGVSFQGGAYVSRVVISYVHPGTDWQNGVQGIEGEGWWFLGRHAFIRIMAGGYGAHTTVTDRSNVQMTHRQEGQRITSSQAQGLVGWRF